MGAIRQLHASQNAQSQTYWDAFQDHRQRITDLVLDAAQKLQAATKQDLSLAVLGAGNGNDLSIEPLLETFERSHLYDLDGEALQRSKNRYAGQPAILQRVQWFDSVDITGVVDTIEQHGSAPAVIDEELLKRATHPPKFTDQHYDIVLSTCTLSQLVQSAVEIFGDKSPESLAFILAIRDGHLNLMLELMKPTAAGILVTDFVSSDTLPELLQPDLPQNQLTAVAQEAIRQRNFFTGANPVAISMQLEKTLRQTDARFDLHLTPPWIWKWTDEKAFCVAAIRVLSMI
ncbi:MAG: hypothetical protein RH917_16820 [Lacipirellulaceae bacterium]